MKFTVRTSGMLLCALAIMFAGCGGDGGPKTYVVRGKVTKGGQAVTVPVGGQGIVQFTEVVDGSLGERTYVNAIKADGTYEVEVASGKFRVSVILKDTATGPDTLAGKFDQANSKIEKDFTGAASNVDIDLEAK